MKAVEPSRGAPRSRLGLLGVVLTVLLALTPVVPAGAAGIDTTSTTGVHMLTVPHDGASGPVRQLGTVVNELNWIAAGDGVFGNYRLWKGSGYPIDVCDGACANVIITDMTDAADPADVVVVGAFKPTSTDYWHGFVWTETDGLVDIGRPTGAATARDVKVVGVDAAGRLAVTSIATTTTRCSASELTEPCSFYGQPDGAGAYTFTEIPRVIGSLAPASDIAAGTVVLGPDLWDPASGFTSLAFPSGGGGRLINESGQIAGVAVFGGVAQAAYWSDRDAEPVSIVLPGDTSSDVLGLSASGLVVGYSQPDAASLSGVRGFLYTPATATVQDLGRLPDEYYATNQTRNAAAYDVNDQGLVVGGTAGRAVIWDSPGTFDINYPPTILTSSFVAEGREGDLLAFQLLFEDPDNDSSVTCANLPSGASCTPLGYLSWQTGAGDAGTYTVTMTVADGSNSVSVDVTITVLPPGVTLDPIGDQTGYVGRLLTFTVTSDASDPEYYVDAIVGGSYEPPPAGVELGLSSGVFTWTPTIDDVGTHTFEIWVWDNATESEDWEVITVTVLDGGPSPAVEIAVIESIGVGETIVVRPPVVISIAERVGVSDAADVNPPLTVSITETVGVSDGVAVRPPVVISIAERVGVSDEVTTAPGVVIRITEGVGVGETAAVRPPVRIVISEMVGVSDGARTDPFPLAAVSGIVWEDTINANGLRDPFEPGMAGVVVYLDLDGSDGRDPGEPTVTTAADGAYRFDGLAPGTWAIRQVVPDGYLQVSPASSNGFEHTVVVGSGDDLTNLDFGNRPASGDSPPVIRPIGDVVIAEGQQVTVVPEIADPEGDEFVISWSGVPEGAVINGIYIWTPNEDQGPGVYEVTVTATQVGDPSLSAWEAFTIVVEEVEGPPVVVPVTPGDVDAGTVEAGGTATVGGSGFAPGSSASILLYSDPVKLASVEVGGDGGFQTLVTIPVDTPPGLHRIVVSGLDPDGEGVVLRSGILVIPPADACTIVGTDGRDVLYGTPDGDVICGLGGNDRILGLGGDDILIGGSGNDRLWGGRGRDLLSGGDGHDLLDGGAGVDVLEGGPDPDLLVGGFGADVFVATEPSDIVWGGFGDDVVVE